MIFLDYDIQSSAIIVFSRESPPIPMLLPHFRHLFNGDVHRLRQKEKDEGTHDCHKDCKEDEQTKFEVAKHCEEKLSYEESE
jgi:hypothetical protein